MATYIKTMKDTSDNIVAPRTVSSAVVTEDGRQLDNTGILMFAQSIDSDVTIAANKNALSVGPVRVADNVTVTVSTGARWVVV